jgi:hypothetical protein
MSMNQSCFFLSGDCEDLGYRNIRDLPHHEQSRAFVESLWSQYNTYADRHFLEDAKAHFTERYWEMYLGVALLNHGLQLIRLGNEGPEFYFVHNDRKIWVEAVAPGPGTTSERVPEVQYGEVSLVPTDKILLRFTNALSEKRQKYLTALSKGIIHQDDLYLLAMNSRRIPHASIGNTMPFFVQALLPFGNLAVVIDKNTGNITDTFYQPRESVIKESGAPVSTKAFLGSQFGFVSAVLHSAVDCVNRPQLLGGDFSILHNPSASHPIDRTIFHWCEQMFYREGVLEKTPGSS